MSTNEFKPKFSSHIGTSSILLIFVVLCMVSFAALSIVSALADYKLTQKVADRTQAYYEASSIAQRHIAQTASHLNEIYSSGADEASFFAQAGSEERFSLPMGETQLLQVLLTFHYPQNDTDPLYSIDLYRVYTDTESLYYDNSLPVFRPEQ